MSDAIITLKSLTRLQRDGIRFTIDGYQRGFRWTQTEVRDLLDDVWEFSLVSPAESGTFYCLQPVVVSPAPDGSWTVVDGQQRLTTIYLFYCCASWMLPPAVCYNLLPFSLRYIGKPRLQECLEILSEKEYAGAKRFSAEMAEYENDIDCHYLLEAYRCIGSWLHERLKSAGTRFRLGTLKDTFDTRVWLIWYELPVLSAADQAALFSMLNSGKIALTDAELVRALLLEKKPGRFGPAPEEAGRRLLIADQWSDMEASLRDEKFWKFLTGGRTGEQAVCSPTRLSFILQVLALQVNRGILSDANRLFPAEAPWNIRETDNREHFSFFVFSLWLKLLARQEESGVGESCPAEAVWGAVLDLYGRIRSWYEDLRLYHRIGVLTATASRPAAELILELAGLDREARSGDSGVSFDEKVLELIRRELFGGTVPSPEGFREWTTGLQYPKDAQKIRQVLLLYNLACLEASGMDSRFPFELYRSARLNWDLEHINAVADPFLEEPDHSIGNLTLLDGGINRAYQNDPFPVKCRVIRERIAQGTFVPLCTEKVFRKDFPGATDRPDWCEEDKKAYTEEIIRSLCAFLKPEEAEHDN